MTFILNSCYLRKRLAAVCPLGVIMGNEKVAGVQHTVRMETTLAEILLLVPLAVL